MKRKPAKKPKPAAQKVAKNTAMSKTVGKPAESSSFWRTLNVTAAGAGDLIFLSEAVNEEKNNRQIACDVLSAAKDSNKLLELVTMAGQYSAHVAELRVMLENLPQDEFDRYNVEIPVVCSVSVPIASDAIKKIQQGDFDNPLELDSLIDYQREVEQLWEPTDSESARLFSQYFDDAAESTQTPINMAVAKLLPAGFAADARAVIGEINDVLDELRSSFPDVDLRDFCVLADQLTRHTAADLLAFE